MSTDVQDIIHPARDPVVAVRVASAAVAREVLISNKVRNDADRVCGLKESNIVEIMLDLKQTHFYKSMDSHINHKIRQDVYHYPYQNLIIYVKFQLSNDNLCVIMSFKEK